MTTIKRYFQGAALAALVLSGCTGGSYRDTDVAMTPAASVDLERYQGLWYEIARFPVSFEEGCEAVTARYALRPSGEVLVLNTCFRDGLDAAPEVAKATATKADASGAKLKVDFVSWLPFTSGDYWVLDVDPDYQVAVVGVPSGSAGWILARTPALPGPELERAKRVLGDAGYDLRQLEMTYQPEAGR